MPLTIPELARAVGKSENYVRQHIFRKHLAVQKDGRNLSVTHDEALRWRVSVNCPSSRPQMPGSRRRRCKTALLG